MASSQYATYTGVHMPPPPPPDERARAAASQFRSLLPQAQHSVKVAVFMTLYSWDWVWNETVFTERLAWKMYDVCPPDLRRALDFIVSHDMPVYIQDERELRRHVYFGCGPVVDWTRCKGDFERSELLSPEAFVELLQTVSYHVQASVARTFRRWTNVKLTNQHGSLLKAKKLEQLYAAAPELLKLALKFILHFERIKPINDMDELDRLTEVERGFRGSKRTGLQDTNTFTGPPHSGHVTCEALSLVDKLLRVIQAAATKPRLTLFPPATISCPILLSFLRTTRCADDCTGARHAFQSLSSCL